MNVDFERLWQSVTHQYYAPWNSTDGPDLASSFFTLWQNRLATEPLNGPDHWRRVEQVGLFIAARTGADAMVVRLFALFHDSRRRNIDRDEGHGMRGAEYALTLRGDGYQISEEQFQLLIYACCWHSEQEHHDNPTIATCWDADRLDLGRLGIIPDPRFLSTEISREIAKGLIDPWEEISRSTPETGLTKAQSARLSHLRCHWRHKVGCSTLPANRKVAEDGVRSAYDAACLKQPRSIIWVNSPGEAWQVIKTRELGKAVWIHVLNDVRNQVVDQIVGRIGIKLFAEIQRQFSCPLLENIRDILNPEPTDLRRSHGCHGADSFGALDFCQRVLGIEEVRLMRGIMEVAKAAGWWWPFSDACVITERPLRIEHNLEKLHCVTGPALEFRDGSTVYALDGRLVPEKLIRQPKSLIIREILRMPTWGSRRLAIERYGMERFLTDSKARIIHSDDFGTLYRKKFSNDREEAENWMAVVKVVNATPERDGSFRDYFLQVPPEIETAREAVAWTFGLESPEYAPGIET